MENRYDAIIVGGGPAGLTAAIYLGRAQYRVLVVEQEKIGGQITITSEVVNYPGILRTDGEKLTEEMRKQAENFGADFLLAQVKELNLEGDRKTVITDKGTYESFGVVLATGANPRKLGFKGEEEFRGRGVAYCATCDGEFFTGMDVFVIGGGFAAAEESVFLTKYAKRVTIIVREEDFTCASSLADEVKAHPDIDIYYETELVEAGGDQKLSYAVFRDNKEGKTWRYEAEPGKTFGIFVFAGYVPATGLFRDQLEIDKAGYLVTDMDRKTSVDGVYGAGDVCVKNLRQVVTAVSDGAVAATSLEKHISFIYEKLKIPKQKLTVRKKWEPEGHETTSEQTDTGEFLTNEMRQQLTQVFRKLTKPLVLEVWTDRRGISEEVIRFADEISRLSDKIQVREIKGKEEAETVVRLPSIRFCSGDGSYLGTEFHGVPGGHELNSFVIAIYNAAGPGQPIEERLLSEIRSFDREVSLKLVISLSCTMCPDLVMAAQRIALESGGVRTEVFDMAHFPDLKEKYDIMSVPCMIVDDSEIYFGKKSIEEIMSLLKKS